MKARFLIGGLIAFSLMVFTYIGVSAQEKQVKKKSLTEMAKEALDKTKAEAMVPGEQHKHMAAMAGDWTYTGKMWMDPSAPPLETSGNATMTVIMEGRFLKQELKGQFQGVEFQGFGLVGYNNLTKQLQSAWVDNMGTAMLIMTGTCDADGKVFISFGEYKDPTKSEIQKIKAVSTIVGPDDLLDEMFLLLPDGKEIKTMELIYKRTK
jgi:hypothetical protein